jgi:hypothetical protein
VVDQKQVGLSGCPSPGDFMTASTHVFEATRIVSDGTTQSLVVLAEGFAETCAVLNEMFGAGFSVEFLPSPATSSGQRTGRGCSFRSPNRSLGSPPR